MAYQQRLSPEAALQIVLDSVSPIGMEQVALSDTLGRVLAEEICAEGDLPPFANTAMDGYAVIAEDTKGASADSPRQLQVLAEEPAGTVVRQTVTHGTAVRIMTGAPIPDGADAIVMVEDTERQNGSVLIRREAQVGDYIRPAGEDVKQGELVLRPGTRLRPAEMGMLAALGKAQVAVFRRPRVAIITSGDELVELSEQPGPGQIRDSNRYSLLGQVLSVGAQVSTTSRVSDEPAELERVLVSATQRADLTIVSGGVSVGDYDFVKDTLARLGEMQFWRVTIKPGKPLAYGRVNGVPLFGLPGNPVSSMVTFDLFVRPALLRMMGLEQTSLPTVSGATTQDIKHPQGLREFVRAITTWVGPGSAGVPPASSQGNVSYSTTPIGKRGSGMLSSMVKANSYIVVGEDRADVVAGEIVQIMLLE